MEEDLFHKHAATDTHKMFQINNGIGLEWPSQSPLDFCKEEQGRITKITAAKAASTKY